MNGDILIQMANDIGAFFASMPDDDEALEGIATHIRKFWAPRMRRQFLEAVDAGGAGVSEIVVRSVALHRSLLA